MTLAGTERRRHQLITAGLGTALTLVMGTVLIMGFRLATLMRANIGSLQTASTLQTYPEEISHQLNSLRDRLEVRAYSGQALADLQGTVKRFDQMLNELGVSAEADSPQLNRALLLWRQYAPVLDPVLSFNAQPYVDSDTAGSSLSREGRQYYAEVKRAQLFARDRKSTRLNSSHDQISYAVFCLKKKKPPTPDITAPTRIHAKRHCGSH